jgi:hypothetical protein
LDLAQRLRTQNIRAEEYTFSPASKQRLAATLLSTINAGMLSLYCGHHDSVPSTASQAPALAATSSSSVRNHGNERLARAAWERAKRQDAERARREREKKETETEFDFGVGRGSRSLPSFDVLDPSSSTIRF